MFNFIGAFIERKKQKQLKIMTESLRKMSLQNRKNTFIKHPDVCLKINELHPDVFAKVFKFIV